MNPKYKVLGMTTYDVIKFQKEHGLIADGMVGYKTMYALIKEGMIHIGDERYCDWKQYNPTFIYSYPVNYIATDRGTYIIDNNGVVSLVKGM